MSVTLSELIITGRKIKPFAMVMYGGAKLGKSTFASQIPDSIFIPTEDGFGSNLASRFPVARTYSEVESYLTLLCTEDHKYKTVVIDTLDKLEKLIWDQVAQDEGKDHISKIGYNKGYDYALKYFNNLLIALDYLRDEKGMNVLLICHQIIKSFTPPDTESFDQYRLDLHEKAANAIKDWADMILFIRPKYVLKKNQDGNLQAIAVGENERVMLTQERPAHWGGCRYDIPYELPFRKHDSYKVFMEALNEAIEEKEEKGTLI